MGAEKLTRALAVDSRAICEALGFDPTNHHNAAKCPYCSPHRNAGVPDDIRAAGWAVAVHNDYRINGEAHTFWLFTRGNECVKGEGRSDAEALGRARRALEDRNG